MVDVDGIKMALFYSDLLMTVSLGKTKVMVLWGISLEFMTGGASSLIVLPKQIEQYI